jgi:hypothetical protein
MLRILPNVFWTAALVIGALWLSWASDSAAPAVVVALSAAVVGFTWQLYRTRARRRALDAYAEREIARAAVLSSRLRPGRRLATSAARPALRKRHDPA